MKTLLTVGSSTLLLPANTDPAAVLKLLVGAKVVRSESHFTKETKQHRSGRYLHAEVVQEGRGERISVSCVPDADVCTPNEWQELCDAENLLAAKENALPETVG